MGRVHILHYDDYTSAGYPATRILPNGLQEHLVYNDDDLPIRYEWREAETQKKLGEAVFQYDQFGRLAAMQDRRGHVTHMRYSDSKGELPVCITTNYDLSIIAEEGNAPSLCRASSYDSNTAARVYHTVYNDNTETLYDLRSYDQRGLLSDIYDSETGGTQIHIEYDSFNNIASSLTGSTIFHKYSYSTEGQILSDFVNNTLSSYSFTRRGDLSRFTMPGGGSSRYSYDDSGRLVSASSDDGWAFRYEYDSAGNIARSRDGRGNIYRYTYDSLDRILSEYLDASNEEAYQYASDQISYVYDEPSTSCDTCAMGKLTTIFDSSGFTQYEYDEWGRVTETKKYILGLENHSYYRHIVNSCKLLGIDFPPDISPDRDQQIQAAMNCSGLRLKSSTKFDAAGRTTADIYPSMKTLSYDYSQQHDNDTSWVLSGPQEVMVTLPPPNCDISLPAPVDGEISCSPESWVSQKIISNAKYGVAGELVSTIFADTLIYERRRDRGGRITHIGYTDGDRNNTNLSIDYSIESSGLISQVEKHFLGSVQDVTQYAYDPAGRLIQADSSRYGAEFFSYDKNGNLLNAGVDYLPGTNLIRQYSYDENGSVTERGDIRLGYSSQGFVSSVGSTSRGSELRLLRDWTGQVVKSIDTADSGPTFYFWNKNGALSSVLSADGFTDQFFVNDHRIGVQGAITRDPGCGECSTNGDIILFATDHKENLFGIWRVVGDDSGAKVVPAVLSSSAYGVPREATRINTFSIDPRFASIYQQADTVHYPVYNIQLNWTRTRDTELFRFDQVDADGRERPAIPYALMALNPLLYNDVNGRTVIGKKWYRPPISCAYAAILMWDEAKARGFGRDDVSHCYASCRIALLEGEECAKFWGDWRETYWPSVDGDEDLENNARGGCTSDL